MQQSIKDLLPSNESEPHVELEEYSVSDVISASYEAERIRHEQNGLNDIIDGVSKVIQPAESLSVSMRSTSDKEAQLAESSLEALQKLVLPGIAIASPEGLVDIAKSILYSVSKYLKQIEAKLSKWVSQVTIMLSASDKEREQIVNNLAGINVYNGRLLVPATPKLLSFSHGFTEYTGFEALWVELKTIVGKIKQKFGKAGYTDKPKTFVNISEFAEYFGLDPHGGNIVKMTSIAMAGVPWFLNVISLGNGNYQVVMLTLLSDTMGLKDNPGLYDTIHNYLSVINGAASKGRPTPPTHSIPLQADSLVTLFSIRDNKSLKQLDRFTKLDNKKRTQREIPSFKINLLLGELSISKEERLEIIRVLALSLKDLDGQYEQAIVSIMNAIPTDIRVKVGTGTTKVEIKADARLGLKRGAGRPSGLTSNTETTTEYTHDVDVFEDKVWVFKDLNTWLNSRYATLSHRQAISKVRETFINKIRIINNATIANAKYYTDAISVARSIIDLNPVDGKRTQFEKK